MSYNIEKNLVTPTSLGYCISNVYTEMLGVWCGERSCGRYTTIVTWIQHLCTYFAGYNFTFEGMRLYKGCAALSLMSTLFFNSVLA